MFAKIQKQVKMQIPSPQTHEKVQVDPINSKKPQT
jgi:hypothetical protein